MRRTYFLFTTTAAPAIWPTMMYTHSSPEGSENDAEANDFDNLPRKVQRRIDEAFDRVTRDAAKVVEEPPTKRRKVDRLSDNQDDLGGGFIPLGDDDGGGGFMPMEEDDDGGGGFVVDGTPKSLKGKAAETPNTQTHIRLSLIPRAVSYLFAPFTYRTHGRTVAPNFGLSAGCRCHVYFRERRQWVEWSRSGWRRRCESEGLEGCLCHPVCGPTRHGVAFGV